MEGKHSEGKQRGGGNDIIDVQSVRFHGGSNLCPVADKLDFTVKYNTLRPIPGAKWEVKVSSSSDLFEFFMCKFPIWQYLLDTVLKKTTIILGKTEERDVDGEASFRFEVSSVLHRCVCQPFGCVTATFF